MQVIDGIQNVTLASGLVRIQTVETGPDGRQRPGETIAIPAVAYGAVVQQLQQAGQRLQQQQQEKEGAPGEAGESEAPSQSAPDDTESEKLNFSNI